MRKFDELLKLCLALAPQTLNEWIARAHENERAEIDASLHSSQGGERGRSGADYDDDDATEIPATKRGSMVRTCTQQLHGLPQ